MSYLAPQQILETCYNWTFLHIFKSFALKIAIFI